MSPCQINVPSFRDKIMTLGAFICKRVTYLCPFLTMCTGPYVRNKLAPSISALLNDERLFPKCFELIIILQFQTRTYIYANAQKKLIIVPIARKGGNYRADRELLKHY